MPAVSREGDTSTGACGAPPTSMMTPIQGTVFANGKLIGVVGTDFVPHHKGPRKISSGSSTVFIEGKASARVGDNISCGDTISTGSDNVFFG